MRNAIKTRLNARRPSIARGTLFGRALRDSALSSLKCTHESVKDHVRLDRLFPSASVMVGSCAHWADIEE